MRQGKGKKKKERRRHKKPLVSQICLMAKQRPDDQTVVGKKNKFGSNHINRQVTRKAALWRQFDDKLENNEAHQLDLLSM